MESKIKRLEIIQEAINRMVLCSFLLKGWSVLLLFGLFALALQASNIFFVYIAYIPIIVFWFLDAYCLYTERLYRNLYNEIRKAEPDKIDSLTDPRAFKGINRAEWGDAILSNRILLFHGTLILTILMVIVKMTWF